MVLFDDSPVAKHSIFNKFAKSAIIVMPAGKHLWFIPLHSTTISGGKTLRENILRMIYQGKSYTIGYYCTFSHIMVKDSALNRKRSKTEAIFHIALFSAGKHYLSCLNENRKWFYLTILRRQNIPFLISSPKQL